MSRVRWDNVFSAMLMGYAAVMFVLLAAHAPEIRAFYVEYAGGGSCKLRQSFGAGGCDGLACLVMPGLGAMLAAGVSAVLTLSRGHRVACAVSVTLGAALLALDFVPIAFESCHGMMPWSP